MERIEEEEIEDEIQYEEEGMVAQMLELLDAASETKKTAAHRAQFGHMIGN